ncbi:GntR family transcriptional regulator [Rubellimicrobium roseum]|uniref:GntR family transcriptional regulator n=1 Tax=Rubellimicrobium roseum TaxID=687525 RepID=UPI001C3F3F47|nr:GntR family transcriptional regulator [Rubellimicrobium roseum]
MQLSVDGDAAKKDAPISQSGLVYEALSAAIMKGELAPGAKLSEPAIAEQLGVSRAPVREAIRRLQERGVVHHTANQGARVVAPTLEQFLALLDVREALEGMTSRLAATAMSEEAVADLRALVAEHGTAFSEDPTGPYMQESRDTDFHVRIARGCGNPVLTDLLCVQFYPQLKLCRLQHRGQKGRGLAAWKEHDRIAQAIADRDGELAELLMRRHIRAARAALLQSQGR